MFHFIYNPIAGKGRSMRYRETLEKLLAEAGVDHAFHVTRGRGDAATIARTLTESASVASDIIIYRRLRDQLLTKTDFMVVEKSREGYDRSKVTSLVMEVRLQSERVQKGLDLLLMNVKSKKGKGQGKDALSEFMEAMKDGED